MINAPDAVVSLWEKEAVRALAAADRATAPLVGGGLCWDDPGEVEELVAFLASALTRAASILAGSAVQATPEGAAVFLAGLDRLSKEFGDASSGWVAGDSGCEGGTS